MKLIQLVFCVLYFCSASFAMAETSDEVKKFVTSVSDDVISILNKSSNETVIKTQLTTKFQDTMDIDWIAQFVMGKHWRSLSNNDKSNYLANYTKFLTASYVPVFKNYNGQKLNILNIKSIGSGYYIVRTGITKANSSVEYVVEYRVKDLKGSFKIRDIIAEGVSMISTQRSEFGSIISSNGLESLNNQLLEKAGNMNN